MDFRRLHLPLGILLLTAFPLSAQVHKPAEVWSEWEMLSPETEEFTVLMPKNRTMDATTFPYHKMELSTRLYLATSSAGPVLAVVSFSGIRSNPAEYTEFARFNSYIDAFKTFFPPKVRSKEALTKLTLVSSTPFRGHTGRSYKLTIGDSNGFVYAFVTRKRFYAVVYLNTRKDEALEEKFLSSFELPERQLEPAKTTTATGDGSVHQPEPAKTTAATGDGSVNSNDRPVGNEQKRAPLAGGMLNSKAIYLPQAEVPPGEAAGVVIVQILVDEQGSVIDARAVSGPQHLQAAAVNAARLARFNPTLLMGEPVKVSGMLSYNFRSN